MKRLGERARAEYRNTGSAKLNKEAEKVYAEEVKSLMDKLYTASLNAPKERQAQLIASKNIERRIKNDPNLQRKDDKEAQDKLKKIRNREIAAARVKVEAKRNPIELTKSEWEAIDAGACTESFLNQIFNNADPKCLNDHAFPKKDQKDISEAQINKIKAMSAVMTQKQIADSLGISVSSVSKYIHS
jgi:DNA-binding transcriptional regulator YiaG